MTETERVAVVTGAGRGIGRAVALAMADAGRTVVATDLDGVAAADTARGTGGAGEALDVADPAAVTALFSGVVRRFGRVDVLVNCAGITRDIDFFGMRPEQWDGLFAVNARGTFSCMQAAAAHMRGAGGGRIVNLSSIAGKGWTGTSNIAYAAAKGAVVTMTRIAAHTLAAYDITVNAVCPGVTRTPLVLSLLRGRAEAQGRTEAEVRADLDASIPLGRSNAPEDVAAVVLFLTSDAARTITGQSVNVDGGIVWD